MDPVKQRLSAGERLLAAGSVAAFIGAFVPWGTISTSACAPGASCPLPNFSFTFNGASASGWLLWMPFGAAFCLMMARVLATPGSMVSWADGTWRQSAVLAAVGTLGMGIAVLDVVNGRLFTNTGYGISTAAGPGIFISAVAVAVADIGAVMSSVAGRQNPPPPRPPRYMATPGSGWSQYGPAGGYVPGGYAPPPAGYPPPPPGYAPPPGAWPPPGYPPPPPGSWPPGYQQHSPAYPPPAPTSPMPPADASALPQWWEPYKAAPGPAPSPPPPPAKAGDDER